MSAKSGVAQIYFFPSFDASDAQGGQLKAERRHQEKFICPLSYAGQHSWNVRYDAPQRPDEVAGLAPEAKPGRIQGFISALPVQWTAQESNNTEFALAVLANNELDEPQEEGTQLASTDTPVGTREGMAG